MKSDFTVSTSLFESRTAWVTALLVLLGLGLAIRLFDLTDLPLDFHPTRQLLSAIKARGMYYQDLPGIPETQRDFAVQAWKTRASVEPAFLESVVAFTYRFTGEQLWVARIFSSVFWVVGALFLFLVARELISVDGALIAAAAHLFLPYGITASRSFQPDPLMVMLIILFWWAVVKWVRRPGSYRLAILAGLLGGLAIYIKFVAAFFVIGGGLGAVLGRGPLRDWVRRPQLWLMTFLGILPGAVYLVYGTWIAGFLGQQFGGRFIPAYSLNPAYLFGWLGVLNSVAGGAVLSAGLLGLFLLEGEPRRFLIGLWSAYLALGLYFNYHISSHDYYSLPLIPIAALSLAPLAGPVLGRLTRARIPVLAILLFGILASLWEARSELKSVDYRPQADLWAGISARIGDRTTVGLTQDYGQRLVYWGWRNIVAWPSSGDLTYHQDLRGAQGDFERKFEDLTLGKDLFLVTDFEDLERQPLLKEKLHSSYPVADEGSGFILFDLGAP